MYIYIYIYTYMVAPPNGSTFLNVYPRLLNHFRCMHECACIYPSVFHVSRFLHSEQKRTPWLMSLDFFIISLRKVKGTCSWIFLGKFFQVFILDIDRKRSWNSLGQFPYISLINPYQSEWKMFPEFLGQIRHCSY